MKSTLPNLVGKPLMFILCIFLFTKSYSQHLMFGGDKVKVEAGLNFGPTFFLGDLGGNAGKGTHFIKDINFPLTKLMKGAFISVYPKDWIGLRVAAQYTYVEGRDNIIDTKGVDELWRKQRNLDFKTTVLEGYAAIEFFPTMLFNQNSENEPRFRPYVLAGAGVFHFNPKGSLTDAGGNKTWYYLHPLRLEGQGMPEYPYSKPYKLTQINIPFGGGLKYYLSDRINLSAEFLYRKTFTDYIDDVSTKYIDPANYTKYLTPSEASLAYKLSDKSIGIIYPGMTRYPAGTQRGDSKDGDTYFSVVMKIGIRLGEIYESSFARRAARQTRCPAVY